MNSLAPGGVAQLAPGESSRELWPLLEEATSPCCHFNKFDHLC